jgi:hypothetical protein
MMPRVKIGDIIEIKTKKGLFYAQYTHWHSEEGEIIQITKTSFDRRPTDLETILKCDIGIVTFLPIKAALREEEFQMVGNAPVPQDRQVFPIFRSPCQITPGRKVLSWLFWDGLQTWPKTPVTSLNDSERKLPIRISWCKVSLLERLESGLKPEQYDL